MSIDISSYLLQNSISKLASDASTVSGTMSGVTQTSGIAQTTGVNQTTNTGNSENNQFSDVLNDEVDKLGQTQTGLSDKEISEIASQLVQDNAKQSKLQEMQELIAALDESILGSVASSLDPAELADDLLSDTSGSGVIDQLVGGHMMSIVTTERDDKEDEDLTGSITNSLTSVSSNSETTSDSTASAESALQKLSDEPSLETLAENLETIMAGMGGITAL